MPQVDPREPEQHGKALWAVYDWQGPTVTACKVTVCTQGVANIWGYSVYRRVAGYRTLGIPVESFMKRYSRMEFFDTERDAINEVTRRLPTARFIAAQVKEGKLKDTRAAPG